VGAGHRAPQNRQSHLPKRASASRARHPDDLNQTRSYPTNEKSEIITLIRRGLKKRCPRCGEGEIFGAWHEVKPECESCGLELQAREADCWGFMYVSTAVLTGVFFISMLAYRPPSLLLGRLALFAAGLALIGITLPYRKAFALALALDYLVDPKTDSEKSGHSE
jgi:uncharacterized protein (DUF983 family)